MNSSTRAISIDLQRIPGFENTNYAYLHGNIVWAGAQASTNHPRNAFVAWQPERISFNAEKLHQGALICKSLFKSNHPLAHAVKGLMLWLLGKEMPFALNLSATRFDAIQLALSANDLPAFTTAALRVLGLGDGLTPSGDDFVGGILFALAHAPRSAWTEELPATVATIRGAAKSSTNVISAALLDDLMAGKSYSSLHDVLIALQSADIAEIEPACKKLLTIGASSGADMLAGLLLALTTQPAELTNSVH